MGNNGSHGAGVRTALVIGGGVAGPVAALALRRAGITATVHEAYPTAADGVGAWLGLAPNGLAGLAAVGADAPVRAIGQPVPGVVMADGAGNRLAGFGGFPELPATLTMPRDRLFRALTDHAVAEGVRFAYGKRLVAAEETPDGVTAHFADGTSTTGDILIGADGIRSTVRTVIDPQAPAPEYGGVLSFGGYATADSGVEAEPGAMHFAFGRAFMGYWRGPDRRLIWFAGLPTDTPPGPTELAQVPAAEWLTKLRELYAGHVPGEQLLRHTGPDELMVVGRMERMPSVPHWHRGRMVLVGDAVHAPSSSSGQGASLAIESAVELARCLRDLPTPHEAFAAYEALRRPRVEAIGLNAAAVNRVKAGKSEHAPAFAAPEEMFRPLHFHRIEWEETVRAGVTP
ncbi:FAD-dependent monooxygenase [Streptomyces sp. Je 1-4]|uniref:FAD-dependent monooxygenase n=1 Tax=Streptomyces TaxID=1883 RepID=UPI0021D850C4|nr:MULTISPECIES: FAD-dependent monooxygenase [unclassified Streptomyces]UYB38044.1 FAD-dependent monooxygenase [Streptomyces sp. Je 1-4]UZQ33979.1 FAD-dependent monooxygenase [Streptomyces sp. Je 1-4] [Streptomyces sp. Je 1-4 4N24]UZQ41397.1 FAD-dependent monooxygenase [Streptomyces sp. Je 1-4] [Streptomyces sp. Je 1-4 4N24_ara]